MRRRSLAAAAAAVTLAVLAGAGTAHASWSASASVSATASSATVSSTLAQGGQLDTTYRYAGSTSAVAAGTLTITNTGGAPLAFELANDVGGSATLAQRTALFLWTGTCGTSIPVSGHTSTTLADRAPVLPLAARTLAPGGTVTVCVATRVSGADASSTNAALQGQSATAAFRVSGAVGTSWRVTAGTATITQSVYRLAAATGVSCANAYRSVVLTWNAPANRTPGSAVSYRVIDTGTGAEVATLSSANASVSLSLDGYSMSRNGTHPLAIEAREGASGTTAPLSTTVSVLRSTTLFVFPNLECS